MSENHIFDQIVDLVCLKSELFWNWTVIECLKFLPIQISDPYCIDKKCTVFRNFHVMSEIRTLCLKTEQTRVQISVYVQWTSEIWTRPDFKQWTCILFSNKTERASLDHFRWKMFDSKMAKWPSLALAFSFQTVSHATYRIKSLPDFLAFSRFQTSRFQHCVRKPTQTNKLLF